MRVGAKILIASLAVATSPLLVAGQTPPAEPPGGPERPRSFEGRGGGDRPEWGRRGKRFGRHGMRRHRRGRLGHLLRNPALRERLGVTPEQAGKIQAQESAFAKSRIQSQASLRVKRMELDELLAAEKPDRAAIDKKMRDINETWFAAQRAAVDHRLAMRDALTSEQKEKMRQWHEERRDFGPRRGPGQRGPRSQVPPPTGQSGS